MRADLLQRLRCRWWELPLWLRWVLLLGLFAGTCALTYTLRWGRLPATPFYPVVLLSIALGTERQGYLLTALAVAASLGLAISLHIPSEYSLESMNSAVLGLVGTVFIVAMRQRRGLERLMKVITYETGVIRALGNYALTRLSREDMMRAVVRYLANSTDADSALVVMPNDDTGLLVGYADSSDQHQGPQPVQRRIADTLAGEVYRSGQSCMIGDVQHEPYYVQIDDVPIHALIAVPLTLAGQPIGVLSVGKTAPHSFTPEDVRLVETLARTLSVPLYASRPARPRNERLRAGH